MVTKDYSKSRMRENRTYGSVRGGQSNLIPSTRLKKFGLPLAGWFRRWQRLTPQFYNATLQAVMGVLKLKGRLL